MTDNFPRRNFSHLTSGSEISETVHDAPTPPASNQLYDLNNPLLLNNEKSEIEIKLMKYVKNFIERELFFHDTFRLNEIPEMGLSYENMKNLNSEDHTNIPIWRHRD